jgi:hypothetical protein
MSNKWLAYILPVMTSAILGGCTSDPYAPVNQSTPIRQMDNTFDPSGSRYYDRAAPTAQPGSYDHAAAPPAQSGYYDRAAPTAQPGYYDRAAPSTQSGYYERSAPTAYPPSRDEPPPYPGY